MNLSTLKKFSALFAITLVFSSVSFAQLNPITSIGSGQILVEQDNYNNIFKAWKVQQQGPGGSIATDALRFSFLTTQDLDCYYPYCPNESSNTFGQVYYYSSSSGWTPIFNLIKQSIFSLWDYNVTANAEDLFDTYHSYNQDITIPQACPEFVIYQSMISAAQSSPIMAVRAVLFVQAMVYWRDVQKTDGCNGDGSFTTTYSGLEGSEWAFKNYGQADYVGTTQEGSGWWLTSTIDWVDIPEDLYGQTVQMKAHINGNWHHFEVYIDRDWGSGQDVSNDIESLEINDNNVLMNLNYGLDCYSPGHHEKWYAESYEIWGDNQEHEVSLPNLSSGNNNYSNLLPGLNNVNFGSEFTFNYKLHYKKQGNNCITHKVINFPQITTTILNPIENLIATNVEDENVKIEWHHDTGFPESNIEYEIRRKSTSDPSNSRVIYVSNVNGIKTNYTISDNVNLGDNFPGDSRKSFTDVNAHPDSTYLYIITPSTFANNARLPNGSPKINNKSYLYTNEAEPFYHGTGAGIPFFNEINFNANLIFDNQTGCDKFILSGDQTIIADELILFNGAEYLKDEVALSFGETAIQKQVLRFYNDFQHTSIEPSFVNHNDASNYVTETLEEGINTSHFEIAFEAPSLPENTKVYPEIEVIRSDNKKFRTFNSLPIFGTEKETPSPVVIDYAEYDDVCTIQFTDVSTIHEVDKIEILRTNSNSLTTTITSSMIYERDVLTGEFKNGSDILRTVSNDEDERRMIFYDKHQNLNWLVTNACKVYTYSVKVSNCSNNTVVQSNSEAILVPSPSEPFWDVVANGSHSGQLLGEFSDLTTEKNLFVSKGIFDDKVHIGWDNYNDGQIDHFRIERRVFGSNSPTSWQEIGVHTTGEKYFEDLYAESNVVYEYRVLAIVGTCETDLEVVGSAANSSGRAIGFRRPTARINGSVIYEGTTSPTPNIYITAEPILDVNTVLVNKSLDLSSGYIEFENDPFIDMLPNEFSKFTLSFWVNTLNLDSSNGLSLFSRFTQANHMSLMLENNKIYYSENTSTQITSNKYDLNISDPVHSSGNWNKITLSSDSISENITEVKLFVNGSLKQTIQSMFDLSKSDLIHFGINSDLDESTHFEGLIDEIILSSSIFTDEEIIKYYPAYIDNMNNDLISYFPCNEGFGAFVYDVSTSVDFDYNSRHLQLNKLNSTGSVEMEYNADDFFSDHIISLANLSITNDDGFFDIKGIRYPGDGANFSVTPSNIVGKPYPTIHNFNPPQSTFFVGDAQKLIQSVAFIDKELVVVSGNVYFDVTIENSGISLIDKNSYQMGVEGVTVLLNGKTLKNDNQDVVTDENGRFEIPVPLGEHCLTFEKDGYSFYYGSDSDDENENQFCTFYDFNMEPILEGDLNGFSCNTYRDLRGRVSGGMSFNSESFESIPLGFDKPANTIGQVEFDLIPNNSSGSNHPYKVNVRTDLTSGEYIAHLLPISHKVHSESFSSSNYDVEHYYKNQQYRFSSIDLSIKGEKGLDGFTEDFISSVNNGEDAITFTQRYDIIYRKGPKINVHQSIRNDATSPDDWTIYIGQDFVQVGPSEFPLINDENGYVLEIPVFEQKDKPDEKYRLQIAIAEEYFNFGMIQYPHDHNSDFYVSADLNSLYNPIPFYHYIDVGELNINNTMLAVSSSTINIADTIGNQNYVTYDFSPDNPYVFGATQDFKRKLTIDYQHESLFANWPINETPAERGDVWLLGSKSYGNDFITFGPQAVDMILRDPAGDGSHSYIEEGSQTIRTNKIKALDGSSFGFKFDGKGGAKVETGVEVSVGVMAELTATINAGFEIGATVEAEANIEYHNSDENEITITESYMDKISTNSGDFSVGAASDLFIGESKNLTFGTLKDLYFINNDQCLTADAPGGIYECVDLPIIKHIQIVTRDENDNEEIISYSYELTNSLEYENEIVNEETNQITVTNLYKLGTQKKAAIGKGTNTKFIFGANYIEKYLIPKLIFLKNALLLDPARYNANTDILPINHPCFGKPKSSPCFDNVPSNQRDYYTIPTDLNEDISMPVLSNFDNERIWNLISRSFVETSNLNPFQISSDGLSMQGVNYSPFAGSVADGYDPSLIELELGEDDELMNQIINFFENVSNVSLNSISDPSQVSFEPGELLSSFLSSASNSEPNFSDVPGVLNLTELINDMNSSGAENSEMWSFPDDLIAHYDQQIYLWKRALATNELDKILALDNSNFITNYSLDGGAVIEHSNSSTGAFTKEKTISYDISIGGGVGFYGSAYGPGASIEASVGFNARTNVMTESTTIRSVESLETIGYEITDDDQGDVISVDIRESSLGYGPIFSTLAGATSCPWEDQVESRFLFPFINYDGQTNGDPTIYYDLNFYKSISFFIQSPPSGLSFVLNNFVFAGTTKLCHKEDYYYLRRRNFDNIELSEFEQKRLSAYEGFIAFLDAEIQTHFVGTTPTILSETTSRRDVPVISCYPNNLYNVLEQEQGVFTLTLGNESEDNSNRIYRTKVVESSNPYGAIIKIDGLSPNRDFPIDANSTINKTLTVQKGPDSLNYENLQVIIYAPCQNEFNTSDEFDIVDTITFSISFLPTCTDVNIFDKDNDWLVNISDDNLVTIELKDYNSNYYSLEKINLYKKFENGLWEPIDPVFSIVNPIYIINKLENYKALSPIDLYNFLHTDLNLVIDPLSSNFNLNTWFNKLEPIEACNTAECSENKNDTWLNWKENNTSVLMEEFVLNEMARLRQEYLKTSESFSDHEMISMRSSSTEVLWDIPLLPMDGTYQIKAKSDCGKFTSDPITGALDDIVLYSPVNDLFTDRIQPQVFGAIQPVDGILNTNDNIVLTFNEFINEIDFNISSAETFITINAIKNQTPTNYDSYLYFDGADSLVIPYGVTLNESFTIEMWINPQSNGSLLYQDNGEDSEQIRLNIIDFENVPSLEFSYTHPTNELLNQAVSTPLLLVENGFTHIAVTYDAELGKFSFSDGAGGAPLPEFSFLIDYVGEGKIEVGKDYLGDMFDLRLWDKKLTSSDIIANRFISLSGTESNLIGYWPMNELRLNPQDKSRYRHASTSAEWAVSNENISIEMSNSYLEFNDAFGIRSSSDFTIEGWFNTSIQQPQTLMSFGILNNVSTGRWAFDFNAGKIEVFNDGNIPIMTSVNTFNDGNWHHLALVKNANSNSRLYIDGVEESQIPSSEISGISGKMFLGRKVYSDLIAVTSDTSGYFSGLIDEIRVWDIAKPYGQLLSDMHNSVSEDEIGLITNVSVNDISLFMDNIEVETISNFQISDNVPLIRSESQKTSVGFNDVSNGNQIAIEILEPISKIENTTLEIKVQNVEDLFGNPITNPIAWNVYIDKNQLIWDDQILSFEKILGESLVIETYIINNSGSVENFSISNLPNWLSVYPTEGLVEPNSFLEIEFIVDENLFIGDYTQDIMLTGNNGYAERLELKLNIEMLHPELDLSPSDYQYAMNFVGMVSVDGIRSRDELDVLYAYVDDELRGMANLIYIDYYDSYLVFLSVYSNIVGSTESISEELKFRLWDASEGKFQTQVLLNEETSIYFTDGMIIGDFSNPAHFKATNVLRQEISLNQGWNWVSFNLDAINETDANDVLQVSTVMSEITPGNVYQIKSKTEFANFDESSQTYYGNAMTHPNAPNGMLPVSSMYMVNALYPDTIVYEGRILRTNEHPIAINEGWNWLSYLGQRSMPINQTMSSLNPSPGDVLKSKIAFSMYASDNLGWLGSLNVMESGDGYMLKTDNVGTLIYPESSSYRAHSYPTDKNQLSDKMWIVEDSKYENSMNVIAVIDHPEYLLADDANLLGAFTDANCVGNINATKINEEESLYFISVYGELDDQVSFQYFDKNLDYLYSTENLITFEPNKLVGSIENPYPIVLNVNPPDDNSIFGLKVFPNPFDDNINLEFMIEEYGYLTIDLFDVTGRKIESIDSGNYEAGIHNLILKGNYLEKGIYIIELLINDVKSRKVIVKS